MAPGDMRSNTSLPNLPPKFNDAHVGELRGGALPSSPDAVPDISGSPTPAWILRVSPLLVFFGTFLSLLYVYPGSLCLLAYAVWTRQHMTPYECLWIFLVGYLKIILNFGIFHRFFAHKCFSASRPVAFVLGIVASTSAQNGPLWWAGKHVRHHKFCENEGDPHSPVLYNWWYAWLGWTFMGKEWHIDWEFLDLPFKHWEMVLCQGLSGMVPYLELYLAYLYGGTRFAVRVYVMTVVLVFITLYINIALHHSDEPVPMPGGRFKCTAHDQLHPFLKYTIDLLGEMDHLDHHKYPRKAFHPSYMGVDLFYWGFIWPGEKLGLFYNVNTDGKSRFKKQQ